MIGQTLGTYRIEEKIGAGAMGVVYRGVDEATGRAVAVKLLAADVAQKGNAASRFRREAEILRQFNHPNIVRFLYARRHQGTSYIVMEFIRGATLADLLEGRGPLPWREAAELVVQLCEALQYTHDRGVFHRDLKPSNLMIAEDGTLKLTDFGIAKDEDATALTATGRTMGTAAYMAPEQIRGTPEVSHKTDLYALGVLLYQMLVGEPPFQGKSAVVLMHAHLTEPPPRASDKVEEIPRALDDLLLMLMAKAPADRPWDAAAVGQKLAELRDQAARGESIPMVWDRSETGLMPTRDLPRPKRKARKKPDRGVPALPPWAGTAGLVLALAAALGLGAYLLWPPGPEYLHRKAAALMASENPDDWRRARSEYLDDLEGRFPRHAHRAEVDAWLDRIALHLARERSYAMTRALGRVRPGAEAQFDDTRRRAEEASKVGRDVVAADYWRRLADSLTASPADRGWALLAREHADDLARAIQRRRAEVQGLLDQADLADRARHPEVSARIRREVAATYAIYPELSDLIERAQAPPGPDTPASDPADPPGKG